MSNTMQIAQTILQQLGGRQFTMMVGAKSLETMTDGAANGGLAFQFGTGAKNKANRVRIAYDYGSDLYNVEFGKIYRSQWKTVSKHEGIYADMLQDLFTEETGFFTTLR
jgi:hypothetical protein